MIGEAVGAGAGEQLRNLLLVQVALHGGVAGRAEQLEGQQHLVALDQLAHLLDRLRRRVAVVILDQIDLAAVHAALLVDHLDVGGLRLGDGRVGRGRPRERRGLADLDLGVASRRYHISSAPARRLPRRRARPPKRSPVLKIR